MVILQIYISIIFFLHMHFKTCCCTSLLSFFLIFSLAGQQPKIHSHNDYLQNVPFWEAYASGATSIEADVILMNDTLFVAHEEESIKKDQTLTSLYLDPIMKAKQLGIGKQEPFMLLVDFKTEAYATMEQLLKDIAPYGALWENQTQPFVKIVVSGNRPAKEDYHKYPFPVFFDHQSTEDTLNLPLDKIELFSLSFARFSQWNGKGRITDEDAKKIKMPIQLAHGFGKPFRFWATPDSKSAWKALSEMGVDFINTDQPHAAGSYLKTLPERLYKSPNISEIYRPTFESDGIPSKVKNVILLIGDGNGLAQLSATMYANNNQLTITQLKNIGLIKTQAADDFTTDSAAAGTALASGQKVKNRSIGMLPDGSAAENLPEYLDSHGFNSGIVSSDNVTGATPSAFYAHQTDRDLIREIAAELSESSLNLFIGGGKNDFMSFGTDETKKLEEHGFFLAGSLEELAGSTAFRVGYFASNQGLPKVMQGRKHYLQQATKASLDFFQTKKQPFFLMVEGAFIDSGGHAHEVSTVIEEGIDFDQAVAEALRFADKDGQTLVIVTADHETGGITIPQGNLDRQEVELEFSTEDHTGIMVPVFAYGPHSDAFRGVYENTAIYDKIIAAIQQYLE